MREAGMTGGGSGGRRGVLQKPLSVSHLFGLRSDDGEPSQKWVRTALYYLDYKYSIICLALSLCQESWLWWSGEGRSWWPGDQLRDCWCRPNEKRQRMRGRPCNFFFFHMEVICLRLHAGKEAASDEVEREVGGGFRMGGHTYTHGWFMSVQLLSRVRLFATLWITARQASLSITNSRISLKFMSIESVMPSSHLILCCPLLLLPPIPPSIRVFSNESTLHMRWSKYWSFSFSISPSNEHPGLISFRIDWLDLLAVQGTLKSSPTPQFKSINSSALSFLHSPTLTSIHDYWKNHSLD